MRGVDRCHPVFFAASPSGPKTRFGFACMPFRLDGFWSLALPPPSSTLRDPGSVTANDGADLRAPAVTPTV